MVPYTIRHILIRPASDRGPKCYLGELKSYANAKTCIYMCIVPSFLTIKFQQPPRRLLTEEWITYSVRWSIIQWSKPKLLDHGKGWRTRHCQLKEGGQERLMSYDCDYHILGINKTQTKVSVKNVIGCQHECMNGGYLRFLFLAVRTPWLKPLREQRVYFGLFFA